VVGRANGRHFSLKTLLEWVGIYWVEKLKQLPMVQILAKGWFMFKFKKAEEVAWVMKFPWYIDSSPVLLKKWTLLFDASGERVDKLSI